MKIKVEFARPQSSAWPWVARLCKEIPSHRVEVQDGLEVHSIEFSGDAEGFAAFWDHVHGWRQVSLFIDGELRPRADGNRLWSEITISARDRRARRLIVDDALARLKPRRKAP